MTNKRQVILTILDGWGIGPNYAGNAIQHAHTPTIDYFKHHYPYTQLQASGLGVGLPKNENGNTETGHLNIGAGRIVYQDLPRINLSISKGDFFNNPAFLEAVKHTKAYNSNLHLIGLIGQGGVHSVNEHLYALLRFAKQQHLQQVYLHLITDGRDSSPTSGIKYLQEVLQTTKDLGIGQLATIVGRYYAMDRDLRYERTRVAYEAIVGGVGELTSQPLNVIKQRYHQQQTDEFIQPIITSAPRIQANDSVIFYNYRIDRPRQLTRFILHQQPSRYTSSIPTPHNLKFITMTEYAKDISTQVAFPPQPVKMPLSKVLSLAGKRQLKLAESEKERFVTYYFNGQHEQPYPGEDVDITPSPKVATYDLQPEMSGREQTNKLLKAIRSKLYDFIVINYANPDMVAHTGNFEQSVKACEFVDSWLKEIYQLVNQRSNLVWLVTADHGNVEELTDIKTGEVNTEHSNFPVPFHLISADPNYQHLKLHTGVLGDIAPTILKIFKLKQPKVMTGHSLF